MWERNTEEHGTRLDNKRLRVMVYENDSELLGEVGKSLVELTERILYTEKQVGLEINAEKTEYNIMILQRREMLDHVHTHLEIGRRVYLQ